MSVAGSVMSAQAASQQGKAQQAQANYQSAVARNNKIIADRQAEDSIKRGAIEERQYRSQVSQLAGRQRAVLAANGVVIDQGSAGAIVADTFEQGELDALTIRSNSEREAYGHRVQGTNFEADARLSDFKGANAAAAGRSGAISSLLGGAGSAAQTWYTAKNDGVS